MVVFYKTKNFEVDALEDVLVDRKDGGHIVINSRTRVAKKEHRWQLSPKIAKELMDISMLVGEAMFNTLNKRGIVLDRINFQDNGNYAVGTKHRNNVHIHLFGRAKKEKSQKRGEALDFRLKKQHFWKSKFKPLNEGDVQEILTQIKILAKKK